MSLAVVALSHSPLYGILDPEPATFEDIEQTLCSLQKFVAEFDPEVTIVFGPDHFNGLFYDLMPAFCIGSAASAVGDWNTTAGALRVDREAAQKLIRACLAAGLDVAHSERLALDHGIAQPLDYLFGKATIPAIVPIVVNAVGVPLGPIKRIRLLGEAVGREALTWNRRVLVVASGGLSHDPPIPRLADASPEMAERLIAGRNPTAAMRAARQERVIAAGRAHAAGDPTYKQINSDFDWKFLNTLARDLVEIDDWSNDEIEHAGGNSAHEIRTWLAAFAALSAAGRYHMEQCRYWPVKQWMTGFAFACARSVKTV